MDGKPVKTNVAFLAGFTSNQQMHAGTPSVSDAAALSTSAQRQQQQ